MQANNGPTKVLRIAVIHESRITTERLIRPGAPVRLGTATTNDLMVPENPVTGASMLLFAQDETGVRLHFSRAFGVGSKLALKGESTKLAALRCPDEGLLLDPNHRGKLVFGGVVVLFQFVQPPPVGSLEPLPPMDFRPQLFSPDDPVFMGSLTIWSALALVLSVWVWNVEAPQFEVEKLHDQLVRLSRPVPVVEEPTPEPTEVPEMLEPDRHREPEPSDDDAVADNAGQESAQPVPRQRSPEDVREEVLNQPNVAILIGSLGENMNRINEAWQDDSDGVADLDALLRESPGGIVADEEVLRGPGCADCDDDLPVEIGQLAHRGRTLRDPGGMGGGPSPIVKMDEQGTVSEDIADGSRVKRVVRKKQGAVKYCYDQVLKTTPDVEGRLEVSWTLERGRVMDVYVSGDTTDNGELRRCVLGKVASWRFPADLAGDVSWPFVFRNGQ